MYGFRDSKDAVMDHHGRHTMPGYDPDENMWDGILDPLKEDAMERMKLDPRRPYRWVPWAVGSGIGLLLGGYPGLAIGGGLGWGYSRYKDRVDPIYPRMDRDYQRVWTEDQVAQNAHTMGHHYQHGGEVKDRFGYGTKENYAVEPGSIDFEEWKNKPWDSRVDIPIMQQALKSIFEGFHPDEKSFHIPRSSWDRKRNCYLKQILGAAKEKKGFPEDMTLRDFGITNEMIGQEAKGEDKNMLLGGIPTDAIRMN